MPEKVIHIPNDMLFEQVFADLQKGQNVSLRVTGNSMHPTFHHGKDVIVLSPCDKENLQAGDVVLFDRGDTICVHRIIAHKDGRYVIRGDGNSPKALEYAAPDKIIAKVTAGTMRGGRQFTIEDVRWQDNTRFVMNHVRLLAFWHRLRRIVRGYPLSILVSLALLYLSLFDASNTKMPDILNYDKYVHVLMYFGVSFVYWFEWMRLHCGNIRGQFLKGFLCCTAVPVVVGGLLEIAQQTLTPNRSGELMDFVADAVGVCAATALSFALTLPVLKRFSRSRAIRHLTAFTLVVALSGVLPVSGFETGAAGRESQTAVPAVKPGIEVLEEMDFAPLGGKKVGLVTNPSGVDHNLRSTIDILYEAPGVELVALFGPEHGVRGDAYAGGKVEDCVDTKTGLPVYSLYGQFRKPSADMLKGIDVMVYDIQDVGARCYTFISTMGLVMEACAEQGIEVVILDRPNPLGGLKVEGCVVESAFNSFVSQYRIPFLYGLTPGELATLINEEGLNRGQKGDHTPTHCALTVIPMKGWTRDMTYDRTGLPWILPSPNIPYAFTALYYAAAGMCGEIGNYLQVGLSYTIPFQAFAATWIDPDQLLEKLQSYNLPGVRFRAIYYKPFAGSQAWKLVKGVQFVFTDWEAARPTEISFYVIQALAQLYPDHLPFGENEKVGLFNKVCGTDFIKKTLSQSYSVDKILPYWRKDEEAFKALSSKYFLYK